MEPIRGSPKPAVRRLLPGPPSPVSLDDIRWSSMSYSESPPECDSHSPSHSSSPPPTSDFFHGNTNDVLLPLAECDMGRPLVYLGSFLGLLCAVGGVATATFVLSGGGHVGADIDAMTSLESADSDNNIEPVASVNAPVNPAPMPLPKPGRTASKKERWQSRRTSSVSTTAPQDDYDEDGMNSAYNEEEDLPSAYEMRRYADELMRHSNDFAKFRTTPASPPPTMTSTEARQTSALERFLPIWRDRPTATTWHGTTPFQEATTEKSSSLSTRRRSHDGAPNDMLEDAAASQGRMSGATEGPVTNYEPTSRPRSTGFEQTLSKAKSRGSGIKVIESGGISTDTTYSAEGRGRGLLALPLPTKVYGPGPRSLLCVLERGGLSRGPPLRECSHLVLGDQVLDLQQRVIKPARKAPGNHNPFPMTAAAVAEQVRALREAGAPGIRVLAGLRSLDVENAYLRMWANRAGLASSANLVYEWVRRVGLDGIAMTNLVVSRHIVDIYVEFLKRLRALFREDYLIVFGLFHRESHEHDDEYTENALRTIVRLSSFTVFESHDARPRPCRSFVLNALGAYRNAVSNDSIASSVAKIQRLGVPTSQTCVSLSLAVMRFLLYDRPRRLGQICHNYFPESYRMRCREWTLVRFEPGAEANTALVHRRPTAVAEILDSFDNETTLTNKVSSLVQHSEVSCVAVYNVEMDDDIGACDSEAPYSRLSAVATALRGTTLKKSTAKTTAPWTTAPTRLPQLRTTSAIPPSPEMTAAPRRRKILKRVSKPVRRRRHWPRQVQQQPLADSLQSSSASGLVP